jgi:hypothetical protein
VVRIFAVLALLALLLLAANFAVGLSGGDFGAAARQKFEAAQRYGKLNRLARADSAAQAELPAARAELEQADKSFEPLNRWMRLHWWLGILASLVALLVNSVTVTYFIGTSRWCKEVCETYRLDADLAARSARLKRSTFPWALAGILSVIGIVGLGAAADPRGANFARAASFVQPHYLAAMLGLAVVLVSFWVQITRIAENYRVIEEILGEVHRIREEKKL